MTSTRSHDTTAWSAHVALASVQLCFGAFPVFGKWAFAAFAPGIVAGWRIGFAAVLFATVAVARHGTLRVSWKDYPRLQLCALLGVGMNQWLYLEGLERSTAVNAGLMMLLIPVFTFAIAVLARQERFELARGIGIAIAFAGTAQLLSQREADLSRPYLFGNLLMVANTLMYSVFLVLSRPLTRRYPPLVLTAWVFVLSCPIVPLFAPIAPTAWAPPDAGSVPWLSLGFVLLFPTVIGYSLNIYALGRVKASTTAVYIFAQPLLAGLCGALVLGEPVHSGTVLAAVCIGFGIWLVVARAR